MSSNLTVSARSPPSNACAPAHAGPAARATAVNLVEDHPDTREVLCLLLGMFGHDVVTAKSMREGLAEIPGAGCDVLLTDIGLPDGSGWELLRLLGDAAPRYTLAMSGYGMSADIERSRSAGFRHHLIKPLGPELLKGYLEEAATEASEVRGA